MVEMFEQIVYRVLSCEGENAIDDVGAEDVITVTDTPKHGVTLRSMIEALYDRRKAAALLQVSPLPAFWRRVAEGRDSDDSDFDQ